MSSRAGDSQTTRRDLVRSGLVVGGASALGLGLLGRESTAFGQPGGGGDAVRSRNLIGVTTDPELNFQLQFNLGAIGYGAGEYGELATTIDRVNNLGASYDVVHDEFSRLGRETGELADRLLRAGHRVSAREAYLRSASYLTIPLYFVLGTKQPSRQSRDYRAMNARWTAFARLSTPKLQYVRIPYGRSFLPGWLMTPPGPRRRRPTVILNNGNDAQNVALYVYGGAAAVERGFNALIFEGPGQGEPLFLRRMPFRPDWEKVITPVVDFLLARDDVDRKRIAIIGWSMGGELVARAAAFERRLAAVVLDPGVTRVLGAFRDIPNEMIDLVRAGSRAEANGIWAQIFPSLPASSQLAFTKGIYPFGQRDFFDQITQLLRYDVRSLLGRVRSPTLVTSYDDEVPFPGQAEEVERLLGARRKDLVRFRRNVGAQFHDAPMAPQRRNQVIFDWIEDTLGVTG